MENLTPEEIDQIKKCGTVLVRNVVDDAQAVAWKDELKQYVINNPVEGTSAAVISKLKTSDFCLGFPEDNKQFFML